ncbi:hypothetical protein MMC15_007812 [Xylographa vitiligo]|nr:hypothetical protein [Xylographa vitiligo]
MAYHYSFPPEGYVRYNDDYPTSTSTTPSPDDAYNYYVPQYRTPVTSPTSRDKSKRQHVRTTSYTTPRVAGWHSPAGYPSPGYYAAMPNYTSPPIAKYDHVSSDFVHTKTRARRFSTSGNGGGGNGGDSNGNGNPKRRASVRSQTRRIYVDAADEAYDPEPMYTYIQPRATTTHTRTTSHHQTKSSPKADNYFFYNEQIPVYEQPEETPPVRSRARRSSTTTKPKSTPTKPAKPAKAPEATAEDAARHNIPAGYSLKNWDPTEEPILLLGSVFDANSLGKWIYDWTVYHHKAGSPLTEVAGELWLLLIKFAGKMKRAEECLPRIRTRDNREMVRDFHVSGERIWGKLKQILKLCEEFMWKAAKREGARGTVKMGEKSGIEFVKSIFGRDRELEKTEKLMQGVRMWNMRFDANCEDILRRPGAA